MTFKNRTENVRIYKQSIASIHRVKVVRIKVNDCPRSIQGYENIRSSVSYTMD